MKLAEFLCGTFFHSTQFFNDDRAVYIIFQISGPYLQIHKKRIRRQSRLVARAKIKNGHEVFPIDLTLMCLLQQIFENLRLKIRRKFVAPLIMSTTQTPENSAL